MSLPPVSLPPAYNPCTAWWGQRTWRRKATGEDVLDYLAGEPARMFAPISSCLRRHIAIATHSVGLYAEEAKRVAATLCPTSCPTIPERPASFPNNGRTLTDDCRRCLLPILTNGKVTGDKVGPHIDLSTSSLIWGLRTGFAVEKGVRPKCTERCQIYVSLSFSHHKEKSNVDENDISREHLRRC